MKFSKLLVMSALWLVGFNANAADLIERTKPTMADVPEVPVEFQVGETYLLYNVTAEKFFTQGNTWGTRGCVGPKASAVLIKVAQYKVNDVWDGKTYEIEDYVTPKTGNYSWYKMCLDDAGSIYTDQTTWGNRFYELQKQDAGTNVYRIMPNEVNALHKSDGTQFLGRDDAVAQDYNNAWSQFTDDNERYPLSAMLTPGDGIHVDWQFFDASIFAIYDKSVELKAMIEKAEAAGVDVTDAVNAYNDLNSTVEDMDYEIKALEEAIKGNIPNATGQFPQDASAWIVNGTFDTVGNFTGWSTNNGKFGAGGTTSTNAEVYGKNAFDINQDITILYPGLYLFGVKGFYRAGSSDNSYQLFSAGSDEARLSSFYVTINGQTESLLMSNIFDGAPTEKPAHGKAMASNGFWIPNTMADANEFFHTDGLYGHVLPVEVSAADVTARIGVKKDQATSYDAWSIFDDFTLIFCGAGEDRWVGYAKILAQSYPKYNTTAVTQSYLEAYDNLRTNATANSKDEAEAYVAQLKAAKTALDLNIRLWKVYEDSVAYAINFVQTFIDKGQGSLPAVAQLNTYLTGRGQNAQKKIEARALTNEQLREELDKLYNLIDTVKKTVDIMPGTDMTDYLSNPAFDTNDWTGWTHQAAAGGNVRVAEKCCEAWNNASFDIYQEVADMPVGVYEISVQGFYRYGRNSAFSDYNTGNAPKNSPTYIYMNANTTSFMNIFAEPTQITDENFYKNPDTDYTSYTATIDGQETTLYFPNGMSSAARAFDNNMFVNSAFGAQVNADDKLRFGVKGSSNQLGDSWVIFDNFKFTFWGKQADKVLPALQGAIIEMEGYLTNTELRVGANIKGELTTAIETAQNIYNTQKENGDTLFAALVNLYNMKAKVRESEALLNGLAAVADSLKEKVQTADMDMVLLDAKDLMDNIGEGLQQRTISDDEVAGLIEQLHAQMAIADKCIELRNAITSLENVKATENEELAELKITQNWIDDSNALIGELTDLINNGTLVIDEIPTWIDKINVMISNKYKPANIADATDANPVNCTAMIQSASFSKFDTDQAKDVNSIDGWKGTDGYNFGNNDTQKAALALEFYHKAFNMYQDIAGLPAGIYEVRVNAFGRIDDKTSQDSLLLYANTMVKGDTIALNNVLVKDYTAGLVAIEDSAVITEYIQGDIDEGTGEMKVDTVRYGGLYVVENDTLGYTPNDMVSSVKYFALNTEKYNKPYTNSVFVKVEEGQTLRLGIFTNDANTWAIMDDFMLICYGASAKQASGPTVYSTGIEKTACEAQVLRTEFFSLNGVRTAAPQRGINIMRQTLSNGMVVVKKVTLK